MEKKEKDEYESLETLDSFISYCEKTSSDEWITDVVRKKGKNCLLGHLVNWFYGKEYDGDIMPIWDAFEGMWATTYMFYPVNDGHSPEWMKYKYAQPTAKKRCVAYLKNLNMGEEKNTRQLIEENFDI